MTMAFLFQRPDSAIGLSSARIPRDRMVTVLEADGLLRAAEKAALQVHQDALDVADEERARAYAVAFEQGRRDGLAAVLGSLEVERRMRDLLADRLGDVVEQCVRNLIGEISPAELFRQRVRHLLRSADGHGSGVRLHVSPSQAPTAQAIVEEMMASRPGSSSWITVSSDDQCDRDTLVLETQVGFVDARVELTLDAARDILRRAITRADALWGL